MKCFRSKLKYFRTTKAKRKEILFNTLCKEYQQYIYHLNSLIYKLKNQIIILNRTIIHLDIKKKLQEKEINNESLLCSICYENKINCANIPCGHTFCERCVSKGDNKCAMCREPVHNYLKIYI